MFHESLVRVHRGPDSNPVVSVNVQPPPRSLVLVSLRFHFMKMIGETVGGQIP